MRFTTLDMVRNLPLASISCTLSVLRVSTLGTDDGLILVHQFTIKRRVVPARTGDDEDGVQRTSQVRVHTEAIAMMIRPLSVESVNLAEK